MHSRSIVRVSGLVRHFAPGAGDLDPVIVHCSQWPTCIRSTVVYLRPGPSDAAALPNVPAGIIRSGSVRKAAMSMIDSAVAFIAVNSTRIGSGGETRRTAAFQTLLECGDLSPLSPPGPRRPISRITLCFFGVRRLVAAFASGPKHPISRSSLGIALVPHRSLEPGTDTFLEPLVRAAL